MFTAMPVDIKQGRGFWMHFPNGWTVSVQWGKHNYCEAGNTESGASQTAEVWAWFGEGPPSDTTHGDVRGWLSAPEVLAYMNEVASFSSRFPGGE